MNVLTLTIHCDSLAGKSGKLFKYEETYSNHCRTKISSFSFEPSKEADCFSLIK